MTTAEFLQHMETTFRECLGTATRKNHDYAGANSDPFKNFRMVEDLGVTTVEEGIVVRLCDKMSRIANLLKQEAAVKEESIADTIDDAINYLAILKAYRASKSPQ
jgi:hypothetical protein